MRFHDNRMKRYPRRAKPIAGIVDRLMRSMGLSRRYDGWHAVSGWPDIVGETIAAVSEAVRYDDGVLYVAVEKDVWRQELAMRTETILKQIQSMPYGRAVERIQLIRGKKGQQSR
jgi:predicted nucleic acid-binding Zn ribbon protein